MQAADRVSATLDLEALLAKLTQRRIHVDRVPEHNHVDDQSERAELILLALPIPLPQLPALAVKGGARKHVTALTAVELNEDATAVAVVVEVVEQVDGLDDAAEFGQRPRKPCRAVVGLKRSDKPRGLHHAKLQGAGKAQQVVPLLGNQLGVDAIGSQTIEGAVIGRGINAPQAGSARVGEPRAELEAEQIEDAEDRVGTPFYPGAG